MDSLTQIVLGSSVAALVTPVKHRRIALVAGAVLGTLPDLDVVWFKIMGSDAITSVTWHRGPSHSLLVLAVFGWLLWLLLKHNSSVIREAPIRWLSAIWLALLTHPLLDAFTVYGTQLLWPLQTPPVMWASIFIIDPLYTLPLLVGVIAAWRSAPPIKTQQMSCSYQSSKGHRWLVAGALISSLYLLWSVVAKMWVEEQAKQSLAALCLQDAPVFSTPLPFNTLFWRVIVMAPDGYLIGDYSLLAPQKEMQFNFFASDNQALAQVISDPQVQRLMWFTHGFVSVHAQQMEDGQHRLILADLRMGAEPDYFFRYDIAGMDEQGQWIAAPQVTQLPSPSVAADVLVRELLHGGEAAVTN